MMPDHGVRRSGIGRVRAGGSVAAIRRLVGTFGVLAVVATLAVLPIGGLVSAAADAVAGPAPGALAGPASGHLAGRAPGALAGSALGQRAAGVPGTAAAAPADVDQLVGQALDQLSHSPVAVLAGAGTDPAALTEVANRARADDVTLWLVSIGPGASLSQDQTNSAAEKILGARHGTVIVFSTDWISVRSDTYSSDERQKASDAAAAAGNGDVAAARAALESLTARPFPWAWVLIGAVVLVAALALAGGLWEKRRRRRAGAEALAEMTAALSTRVGDLAPAIVALSGQIDLVDRPDLSDRFNQASSDYNSLRDTLGQPLPSRRAVRKMDGTVTALEREIADLTSTVGPLITGESPAKGPSKGDDSAMKTGPGSETETATGPA